MLYPTLSTTIHKTKALYCNTHYLIIKEAIYMQIFIGKQGLILFRNNFQTSLFFPRVTYSDLQTMQCARIYNTFLHLRKTF